MSGMDLDAMRGRWKESNRQVDEQLHMDVEAMRRALAGRRLNAFRRHSRWLVLGMVAGAITVVALLAFMFAERHDWRYLFLSAPLLALVLAELVVTARQWLAVSRLDLSAPMLQVRDVLDVLRARRLRMTKWIIFSSVLLWWPVLIVLLRGLTGFDLLRVLHPSVITITVVIGLAFIPVGLGIGYLLRSRFAGSPGYERFLRDAAGRSWSKAEDAVQASLGFEQAVEGGTVAELLTQPVGVPPAAGPALAALKRATLGAILSYAVLLAATGLFNLLHGGQALQLVAGIALNLAWIPLMVTAIIHYQTLANLDFGTGAERLRGILTSNVALRASVARIVIVLSPLVILPMVVVAVRATTGIALLAMPAGPVAAAAVAISASMFLTWKLRRAPGAFCPALVEAMLFGAPTRTVNLLAKLAP